jgi:hypothetical protein
VLLLAVVEAVDDEDTQVPPLKPDPVKKIKMLTCNITRKTKKN